MGGACYIRLEQGVGSHSREQYYAIRSTLGGANSA